MQEHFFCVLLKALYAGITPACAGTFHFRGKRSSRIRDHPCVCRNIYSRRYCLSISRGSPLRVQEHYVGTFKQGNRFRITPACAGTFYLLSFNHLEEWDHPCVCRNIFFAVFARFFKLGSPLRVQEHSSCTSYPTKSVGITPACAGTLKADRFFCVVYWDHPCVCRNILNLLHDRRCV